MNEFLSGMIGGMIGSFSSNRNTHQLTYRCEEKQNNDSLISEQKKANRLKEEELELQKKENKKKDVKQYIESINENIDRDCLEIDIYDKEYQRHCLEELTTLANKESEGRWITEKFAQVYGKLFRSKDKKEQDICRAYEKIIMNKDIEFGDVVGRSEDRYDYIMGLKIGPSYTPKYISRTTLQEILKSNKYGMSEGIIL